MKKFVVVLVLAAAVFFLQRRGARDTASDAKAPAAINAAASATPRPIYQHDWAKHSLDRAQTVVDQAKKSREENEQP
jgi:hypothetical protein